MRALLLIVVLLAGCATTEQGKEANRAQLADIGSTGLALTLSETAVEANPAGLYILPLKLGTGWIIDTTLPHDCMRRAAYATTVGIVGYGAAANNLAIAAGVSSAPIIGLVGAVGYGVWKWRKLHTGYDCIPDDLKAFADAYRAGDAEQMTNVFAEDGMLILPWAAYVGHDSIRALYTEWFGMTRSRTFWALNWDGERGLVNIKVDGGYDIHEWQAVFDEDGKINTLVMGEFLKESEWKAYQANVKAAMAQQNGGTQ